jgi:hypothetical protein
MDEGWSGRELGPMGMELRSEDSHLVPMGEEASLDFSGFPMRLHFESFANTACAIGLPNSVEGPIAFISDDGQLDLTVSADAITFDCPSFNEPITLFTTMDVGERITLRPLAVAPPAEETCQHGISPKSKCPLNPP